MSYLVKMRRKQLIALEASALAAVLFACSQHPVFAQNRTAFAGQRNAIDYAYGVNPRGPAALQVAPGGGTTTTGSGTLTLSLGYTTAADGTQFAPLNVNAPVIVGAGSSMETVTPTAVNCNTPAIYMSCSFTATFTYTHGTGENIASGSVGLQESINIQKGSGGGAVFVTPDWASYGGTNAIIAAAAPYSSVYIQDERGQNGTSAYGSLYWTMQPTTLSSLAVPTPTLSSTTAVFSGSGGTWTATAAYLCYTYVDALGGEGPCSATSNQTPTANNSLTVASPVASTGAVGWRMYAGASYNAAYLLPITSTACTLTTLEAVIPACAIGSSGTWPAIYTTTTTLRPNAQTSPVVNVNLPYPQGHTTFGYIPSGTPPEIFQTHYGPFVAFGSTTMGQTDVIGAVNLPAGFLNYIGRTVRISGKLALTVNTAAVPTVTVGLGWAGGLTAGAPIAVCTLTGAAYGSSAAYNAVFDCDITTNAAGTTAVATTMTNGKLWYAPAAGGAGAVTVDTGTAAITTLGFFSQDTVYIEYTSGTNTSSAVQLLDLHVETLQ